MKNQHRTRRRSSSVSYSHLERREVLTSFLPAAFDLNITANELVIRADPNSMETNIEIIGDAANNEIVVTETRPGGNVENSIFALSAVDRIRYVGNDFTDRVSNFHLVDTLFSGRGGFDNFFSVSDSNHTAVLYGGDGDDILRSGNGNDRIFGGNGDDFIRTDGGDNLIFGSDGNDIILSETGVGDDTIYGGAGDDNINSGGGDDLIVAGNGDCLLYTSPSPRD